MKTTTSEIKRATVTETFEDCSVFIEIEERIKELDKLIPR